LRVGPGTREDAQAGPTPDRRGGDPQSVEYGSIRTRGRRQLHRGASTSGLSIITVPARIGLCVRDLDDWQPVADCIPDLSIRNGKAETWRNRSFPPRIKPAEKRRFRPLAVERSYRRSRPKAGARLPYSITSSARINIDCGTVRPSALAVFRLITSSNLVGCWTGRSAGFAPLRIVPA
jgi:hypothetical protein